MSIRTTPAGRARSVATARRATAVINPTFGVARAEGKRMPISTLPRISGRAALNRPNVTWSRIVCRIRFASGGFQPQSQALAFRRGWFTRNIVYPVEPVRFTASSAGIRVHHNTLIAPVKPMLLAASNVHYRNNLILGKSDTLETFAVETNTNNSSSDYNGFRPNENRRADRTCRGPAGLSPGFIWPSCLPSPP